MTEKYCKQCGEPIPKDNNWGIKQYCDKKCYCEAKGYNYYGPKIEKIVCQNPDCPREGEPFKPKQRNRETYCSRACAYQVTAKRKAARAERLEAEKEQRVWWPRIVSKPVRYCEVCGNWLTNKDYKYCSDECRAEQSRRSTRKHHYENRSILTEHKCKECGGTFNSYRSLETIDSEPQRKYCSQRCRRKGTSRLHADHKARRRALKKGATTERVYRRKVFERDKYVCQICGEKILKSKSVPHPKSATLDHRIPLVKGGEHNYDNVQAAHFMCNSIKSDNIEGVQTRMRISC